MLSKKETIKFRRRLLRWFEKHKRNLPWRKTKDSYQIWIIEGQGIELVIDAFSIQSSGEMKKQAGDVEIDDEAEYVNDACDKRT